MEKKLEMGKNSSRVFSGEAFLPTNNQVYRESAGLISEIIKSNLIERKSYTLLDLGSASGELVENIIKLLPDFSFKITAVDVSKAALDQNKVSAVKITADLTNIPIESDKFDISIMRYVLQWNPLDDQEKIIKEVLRLTNGIAIIQHVGPDHANRIHWRQIASEMFNHKNLPKLHRNFYFFSSAEEVEAIYIKNNISFKRIQNRTIESFSDIFIERFNLNEHETILLKKILEGQDHIEQALWLLDFRNK